MNKYSCEWLYCGGLAESAALRWAASKSRFGFKNLRDDDLLGGGIFVQRPRLRSRRRLMERWSFRPRSISCYRWEVAARWAPLKRWVASHRFMRGHLRLLDRDTTKFHVFVVSSVTVSGSAALAALSGESAILEIVNGPFFFPQQVLDLPSASYCV